MVFLLVLGLLFSAPTFAQTAQSYRQKATELARNKSWDQAILNYREALALEPNDSLTHYNLALALKYKGDAKQAAEEFEATLRLQQNNPSAAEGELRQALKLKPSAEMRFELGLTEAQLGNLEAVAAELRRALNPNPRFAKAHSLLGVTLRRQGNHAGALAEFRKAVDLDAKDPEAQYNLGMELKADSNTSAAIAAFRR